MGNVGYQTGQEQEGLVDQASARVQDAASAVREQGRSKLGEQLDTRSRDAGGQMRSAAQALRKSASSLRDEGNSSAASIADQVADRAERLGSYLEEKRGDELMHDVEDFARRRPWLIAGAGLVAGLAASRFVKASSEGRYSRPGTSFPRTGGRPIADAPLARDPSDSYGVV